MDTVMMQVLQCFGDYILLLENAYIEQTLLKTIKATCRFHLLCSTSSFPSYDRLLWHKW